jgi:hypothetical protein
MSSTYSTSSNHIARLQCLALRDSPNQGRNGKDEIFCSRALPKLAIDMGFNLESRWQVVFRDSNRTLDKTVRYINLYLGNVVTYNRAEGVG